MSEPGSEVNDGLSRRSASAELPPLSHRLLIPHSLFLLFLTLLLLISLSSHQETSYHMDLLSTMDQLPLLSPTLPTPPRPTQLSAIKLVPSLRSFYLLKLKN